MLLILVMRTNTKRMLPILGLTKSNAAGGDGNYYKSREREREALAFLIRLPLWEIHVKLGWKKHGKSA